MDAIEKIEVALLTSQRKVLINSNEIYLKPLKRDTRKNREREARQKAKELFNILITN